MLPKATCIISQFFNMTARNYKHGFAYTKDRSKKHPLYYVWQAMKQRCQNPNNISWLRYGGRGIQVCKEWLNPEKFINWMLINGWEPGMTIDRIDTDGNYIPENCQIVSKSENSRKRQTDLYKKNERLERENALLRLQLDPVYV